MQCIGVDIVEISRIEGAVTRWGDRFLKRVYTEKELELCRDRSNSLAAHFAAKEAAMKALGTGTMKWRDIETLSDSDGQPLIYLHGKAQKRAGQVGLKGLTISLSHCRDYAIASVIGEGT